MTGPPNDLYIETVEELLRSGIDNGIDDYSYEKEPKAQAVLRTLDLYFEVLKDHPKRDPDRKQGGLRLNLFRYQFVILTVYLLLSKLRQNFALQAEHKELIAEYLTDYITKVKTYQPTQEAYKLFEFSRGKKAQSKQRMEEKDRILNRDFWKFVSYKGVEFRTIDKKRLFALYNVSKYMSIIKVSAKTARKKCRGPNMPPIISIRFLRVALPKPGMVKFYVSLATARKVLPYPTRISAIRLTPPASDMTAADARPHRSSNPRPNPLRGPSRPA